MTFNDNADIDNEGVKKIRGGAGRTAMIGGGGVVGVLVLFVLSQFLGVDLTGLLGGDSSTTQTTNESVQNLSTDLDKCKTGADANKYDDCRMVGAAASLNAYWATQVSNYSKPTFYLVEQSASTPCGTASNDVGPFYCPTNKAIYIDPTFWSLLRTEFGATAGPLAQMYVLSHEWGHHIQNLTGTFAKHQSSKTGAGSDSVRLELQADCYAGSWVAAASSTKDDNGVAYLKAPTKSQIADALNAAASVGDDHIQEQAQGSVQPDAWTHGSSEERQRWFNNGYNGGPKKCDTFAVKASAL